MVENGIKASSAESESVVSASFGVQFKSSPNWSNFLLQRSGWVYGFGPLVERQQSPTQRFNCCDYLETAANKSKFLWVCVTAKLQKVIINILITAALLLEASVLKPAAEPFTLCSEAPDADTQSLHSSLPHTCSHPVSSVVCLQGAFDLLIVPFSPHHL